MRFNTKSVSPNHTVNAEGAKAYKLSLELELYTAVMTRFLSKQKLRPLYKRERNFYLRIYSKFNFV
jgi:hypothetical protein